ncbi:MAG: translocation/assembly module TamB domain-containing protein [Arcobacteraceae bacterium]
MKTLKILFLTFVMLFLLGFFIVINSSSIAFKAFNYITSSYDISYSELSGNFSQGIYIKDINYQDKIKCDLLFIRLSLSALLANIIHIYELKLDGLYIDSSFLELSSTDSSTTLSIPFKLVIDSFELETKKLNFQEYIINKLKLKATKIKYDFLDNYSANIDIFLSSDIGNIDSYIELSNSFYQSKGEISLNKEIFNSIENLQIDPLSNMNFSLKGDTKELDFALFLPTIDIKYQDFLLNIKEIKTDGIYNISNSFLDIKNFSSKLTYDKITTFLNANFQVKDHDINSIKYSILSDTIIDKSLIKELEKDLKVTLTLNGDLQKAKVDSSISKNRLFFDSLVEFDDIHIKADVNQRNNFNDIYLNFEQNSKFIVDDIDFTLNSKESKLHYNLSNKELKGLTFNQIKTELLNADFNIDFLTNTDNITDITLKSDALINSLHIQELDLEDFYPIKLSSTYQNSHLSTLLKTKNIVASIDTKDLKEYIFELNVEDFDINRFYTIPDNIKLKQISSKVNGIYNINDTLFLKGDIILNDNIVLNSSLIGSLSEFKSTIKNQAFVLNLSKKDDYISSDLQIDSLIEFQKELIKLVDFEIADIYGKLSLQANLEQDKINFFLSSPKISYQKTDIDDITLKAMLTKDILYFEDIDFYIDKIEDIIIEKKFSLAKKGFLNTTNLIANIDFGDIRVKTSNIDDKITLFVYTKELSLSHLKYGSGKFDANLIISYEKSNLFISGKIDTKKLNIIYQIPTISINSDKDIIIISKNKLLQKSDFYLDNISLSLEVESKNFDYKVKNISLQGSSYLYLKKDLHKDISIYGSISDTRGKFSELGREYLIESSNIYFRGLVPIDPVLEIKALHKLPDVDISISIAGTLHNPIINLSSTPQMNQRDILSYLIFGTRFADDNKTTSSFQDKGEQASLFVLNELSKDYAKELGLDVLYFEYDPTTQYIETSIGKNISQKSKIIVQDKFESGKLILLRELTKLWNVELGIEEKTQSIDFTYKKRY